MPFSGRGCLDRGRRARCLRSLRVPQPVQRGLPV